MLYLKVIKKWFSAKDTKVNWLWNIHLVLLRNTQLEKVKRKDLLVPFLKPENQLIKNKKQKQTAVVSSFQQKSSQ